MFVVGCVVVLVCVFGGYAAMGGKLGVLWQPFEYVIICGAAIGAFLISNTKATIDHVIHALKALSGGPQNNKDVYLDLLGMLYSVFKLIKAKGFLAIESHLDAPKDSEIFKKFPKFIERDMAVSFFCDYLRIAVLGNDKKEFIEAIVDVEIENVNKELAHAQHAVQGVADGMPALGIVAAVLGVIKTMGSITEPPEVLGKLIGGALVGTFVGVFVAYGYIAPMATMVGNLNEDEAKYLETIKVALLTFLSGASPLVSIEAARKSLYTGVKPTFLEMDSYVNSLPPL